MIVAAVCQSTYFFLHSTLLQITQPVSGIEVDVSSALSLHEESATPQLSQILSRKEIFRGLAAFIWNNGNNCLDMFRYTNMLDINKWEY